MIAYAFSNPRVDVEEDIVTPFSTISKRLRNHHIVFSQPGSQLLMVPPVAIVAVGGVRGVSYIERKSYSSCAAMICATSPGLL
jgi:hypothetical protein